MYFFQVLYFLAIVTLGVSHPLSDTTMSSVFPRMFGDSAQIGQYTNDTCHHNVVSTKEHWPTPGHMASVNNIDIEPVEYIVTGDDACTAWYPVLNQTIGPSVGINFASHQEQIKQVQFFKSNPACEAIESRSTAASPAKVCCDPSQGAYLGKVNANGTDSDFGAVKDMGFAGSMCIQLGPSHNQTLWEMKYFKGVN